VQVTNKAAHTKTPAMPWASFVCRKIGSEGAECTWSAGPMTAAVALIPVTRAAATDDTEVVLVVVEVMLRTEHTTT
jgi:hypothetical protein